MLLRTERRAQTDANTMSVWSERPTVTIRVDVWHHEFLPRQNLLVRRRLVTRWGFEMPLAIVQRHEYAEDSQTPYERILCSQCGSRRTLSEAFRSIYLDMVWLDRYGTRPLANGTMCMYCNKELINNMCYRKLTVVHGAGGHLKFCCVNCYRKYVSDEDWFVKELLKQT